MSLQCVKSLLISETWQVCIYMDTRPDHLTPLALRVRGNYAHEMSIYDFSVLFSHLFNSVNFLSA